MKKLSGAVALALYYSIARFLPSGFTPLIGPAFNSIRVFLIRGFSTIGDGCRIQPNVYIGNGSRVLIGDCCQINQGARLNNVEIGNFVMIAPGVTILGVSHETTRIDVPMVTQGTREMPQGRIEDDVWIATNAIIMPGLRIRRGCIIGAGSVLTKDTEEFGIYGGVPAKLIRRRRDPSTDDHTPRN